MHAPATVGYPIRQTAREVLEAVEQVGLARIPEHLGENVTIVRLERVMNVTLQIEEGVVPE